MMADVGDGKGNLLEGRKGGEGGGWTCPALSFPSNLNKHVHVGLHRLCSHLFSRSVAVTTARLGSEGRSSLTPAHRLGGAAEQRLV